MTSKKGQNTTSTISNPNYQNGITQMHNAQTTGNWYVPFNSFEQILSGPVPQHTAQNIMLWENSWENLRNCLKEMYTLKQLSGSVNQQFVKTINANNKMLQFQNSNYYRKFQLALEKATIYRMAGDYNTAIDLLTPMTSDTATINREQAESWLCVVQLEKQIAEGTIVKSQIQEAMLACPNNEENSTKEMHFEPNGNSNEQLQQQKDSPWLNVMPNPINGSTVIAVNNTSENESTIEVTDIFGRIIKTIKVSSGYSESLVSFSEISEGIYYVSLKKNEQILAKTMIVIEK